MNKLAQVLQQDDVQSELLFHQASTLYYEGKFQKALELFKESLELDPSNENSVNAIKMVEAQLKK